MAYKRFLVHCVQAALIYGALMSPARADWSEPSLEFKCDRKAGVFALRGVVDANGEAYIAHRPGFTALAAADHRLTCRLHGSTVSVNIGHVPPHERGICAAVSYYSIDTLAVGKTVVFRNEAFNHICGVEDSLHEVTITTRGGKVQINSCTGKWDWERRYDNRKCVAQGL